MSARVRFLPAARADLHQIWDYIADDDVAAAMRLVDLVEEKFHEPVSPGTGGRPCRSPARARVTRPSEGDGHLG